MGAAHPLRSLSCSSVHFAIFRILLGSFLCLHFASLIPFASEIYGPRGMYPVALQSIFPSILVLLESELEIRVFFILLCGLSLLLLAGVGRQICALLLWYGWACTVQRVPILAIPSEGLVGWLLLFIAVVPSGEAWSLRPQRSAVWKMPSSLIASAWVVLGVGYLASGLDKLASPSWQAGVAVRSVLTSPIAHWDVLADSARRAPELAIGIASWAVVFFEIAFLPMILFRMTRAIAWFALTLMHLGIRASLDLSTISDPFLIAHILVFDERWMKVARVFFKNLTSAADRKGEKKVIVETRIVTVTGRKCHSRPYKRPLHGDSQIR